MYSVYIYCRHINVRDNFGCSNENILNILQLHPNPEIVTELDFSFCYWIASKEVTDFVKQCRHLDKLSVAHSTIGSQELEEILCENAKISKLSFSINDPKSFGQNEKLIGHYLKKTTVLEDPLSLLNLSKCRQTLAQLETLELYIGQYPIILTTLLKKTENIVHFISKCIF